MASKGFEERFAFLGECARLMSVQRGTTTLDGARQENPAEHTWHSLVMLLLFELDLPPGIDVLQVMKLLIVHDMHEIYADDVSVFDREGREAAKAGEREAARQLFGQLSDSLGRELLDLWEEFEAGETREARVAQALDRRQPFVLQWFTQGAVWRDRRIRAQQVREVFEPVDDLLPLLDSEFDFKVDEAERRGFLTA